MRLKLHIQNFGKITDAKIEIAPLTVFAGPNNTGKSFVSKLLYSLFDSGNADSSLEYLRELLSRILSAVADNQALKGRKGRKEIGTMTDKLVKHIREMGLILDRRSRTQNTQAAQYLLEEVGLMKRSAQDFKSCAERHKLQLHIEIIDRINKLLDILERELTESVTNGVTVQQLQDQSYQNLTENFQVGNLSVLKPNTKRSKVEIDGIGIFEIDEANKVKYTSVEGGIEKLQKYSRVIYLESPLYWNLKFPLENVRNNLRFIHLERKELTGVPKYFYDFVDAVRPDYTGDIPFPDLYEKLISDRVIGGKIIIGDLGEWRFQEKGNSFPLSVTATGVVNLGTIALLIERKVLDKGSVLFIDEPEAHLHPAWQVIMAKTLFELAKGGVHVVIATHSPEILKWLEVHIKKNPDDENLIALNKFPANGDELEEQDFVDKIASIKQELTKPFADLYMAGL